MDSTGTDVKESDVVWENFVKPGFPRPSGRGGELLLVLGSDNVDAFASPRIPSGVGERMPEVELEIIVDGDGGSKSVIPI